MMPPPARPRCALTSVLPVLLLAACASRPAPLPVASICPKLPPPPSAAMQNSPASYSLTVQKNINLWEKKLTNYLQALD